MGLSKVTPEIENADLDCEPQGEYVRPENVARIDALLANGERVHYLFRATALEVDGERDLLTDGPIRTAATDGRLVLKIPRVDGTDERSIPYETVRHVDFDTGLVKSYVSFETAEQTYHVEVKRPEKAECRQAVEFVREQVSAQVE